MTILIHESIQNGEQVFRAHLARVGTGPDMVTHFRTLVRAVARRAHRAMPWRDNPTPYHVLVSEIMLQQTQVSRVLPKYEEFIRNFPDFTSLSRAPLADVLRAWQGLGYNRRGRALWVLAREIVEHHRGMLPADEVELRNLPGIGPYTAGAIMAFAFNKPVIFIETNIRTVFLHLFFHDRAMVPDSDLLPLIGRTLDRRNPRRWYNALMDYGAWLKGQGVKLNRKNPVYRPQTRFKGSRRQLRGCVLRSIASRAAGVVTLCGMAGNSPAEVRETLDALVREGLVRRLGRRYALA